MTEDSSVYEEVFHNGIEEGSKNIDPKGNITRKRVQFSEPLEYWREFDKETGELCEEKKPGEQQESIRYCGENVDDKLDQSGIEERTYTETQTELIQSLNKVEDTRIGTQRQIKDKRKECSVESKQIVKLDASYLPKKQLTKNSPIRCLEESSKTSGKINLNLRGACPVLQKYCAPTAVSTSIGKKPSPLPLGFNRKIYDERLLPSSFKSGNKSWNSSSKTGETGTGLPPVVGNVRTPHIVQLFD